MVMRVEPDFLMRAVVKEPAMRLALGGFRELCSEGIIRHDADPVAGRLLAGVLCSGALMTVLLDDGEKYSIRIDYPGPVGAVMADANADGRIRALVRNPHVMSAADSIEVACGGEGARVRVTRSKDGKILNSGESESVFIMPSAALGYYLSVSDQVESEIRCEVELQPDPKAPVRSADAVLIQALPGCDLEAFDRIRRRLLLPEANEILRSRVALPEEKLRALLMFLLETPVTPEFAAFPVAAARFHCGCSAEHLKATALQMLGRDDIEKLFAENPAPAIRCHFCNTEYRISRDDFQ